MLLYIALDKPLSFTKMVYDNQGIFELSWKDADALTLSTTNQLDFYTIFWCEKDQINPQQCNVCKLVLYSGIYFNIYVVFILLISYRNIEGYYELILVLIGKKT